MYRLGSALNYRILIIFLTALITSNQTHSQEASLQKKITIVQELLTSVEANKLTFNQDLKTISPGYYDYSVVEVNGKGQEEETIYSFALSDINKNGVRSYTKKDVILIELTVSGKQKLIKKTTDGGSKISYQPTFVMYGLNADNGRDLENALEDAIPDAEVLEKDRLSLTGFEDHLNWLKDNVGNVNLPKEEVGQEINTQPERPDFIVLEQILGSKKKRFEFNLSVLNPNSVNYKISGEEFLIEVGTKKGVAGIKYFENDELQGYTDQVLFYASSLANGKSLHRVLRGVVPLAESKFDETEPNFSKISLALDYINSKTGHVESDGMTTAQNLVLTDHMATLISKENEGDKNEEHEYLFNLTDINKNGISIKEKRTRLFLVLNTNKSKAFISHRLNGEIENFEKELLIYFDSYEDALRGKIALQALIDNFEDNESKNENLSAIDLNGALSLLKKEINQITGTDHQIEQHIELLESEESSFKFTKIESNSKKITEVVYEFSIKDLNEQLLEVEVSGKRAWAEIGTKSAEKVVKVYEDGEVQNYVNHIEIETPTIENAKNIVLIFKRLAESID
ncbi:hypothetical protein B0O79_3681 [Flavobacteriaceae bacterium MAR_2009_75]|nr:hypothetical protein B0O79_3681 [Flavobacteriaceae bacterium MAR_2009_75]